MIIALIAVAFLALLFVPSLWVNYVMQRHSADRPDYPGTGGELAVHLLERAGLGHVKVEVTPAGDHYDPIDKAVRLTQQNFEGRSLTAVAVATHEVAHALQDAQGYAPLHLRTRLAGLVAVIQKAGSAILLATPFIGLLTRAPSLILFELAAGLALMASSVVAHLVTLPMELDASFKRALPMLEQGEYIHEDDLPAARQVLKAAAFTYIASALISLLNVMRWLRVLRF